MLIAFFSAGVEKMPMVRGEENGGRLVFMYEPKSCFVSPHNALINLQLISI